MEKIDKKDRQFIKKIRNFAEKTIKEHQLIESGDKILLGLSGGKDSMALLDILGNRKLYVDPKFDIIAVHIKVKKYNYEIDRNAIDKICDKYNIEYLHKEIEFNNLKSDKTPCFICSWNRRKALFNIANELNCNKLALGHHKDDAIETMLLNMIYHGTFSSMPHKLNMFKEDLVLIRPLLDQENKTFIKYAKIMEFPDLKYNCIHEVTGKRTNIKELINIMEKLNPKARNNLYKSMSCIYEGYLPKINKKIF